MILGNSHAPKEGAGRPSKPRRVYHFSEDTGIEVFAPRSPLARPEVEPLVWAVDEWHAPHYFLPRDCPRACFWPRAESTARDRARYLRGADRVIAIEKGWLGAVRTATVYRYEFDSTTFELVDDIAGYYVSRETLRPLSAVAMRDLPAAISAAGIELRAVDNLHALHLEVVASTLEFSGTRLRNALDFASSSSP